MPAVHQRKLFVKLQCKDRYEALDGGDPCPQLGPFVTLDEIFLSVACPQRLTVPIISPSGRTASSGLASRCLLLPVKLAFTLSSRTPSSFCLADQADRPFIRPSVRPTTRPAGDGGGRCGLHLAAVGQEEDTERMSQLIVQYPEREKVVADVFYDDENFIVYVVAV